MNDSLDLSKLDKLELRKLWRTGTPQQRRHAARELQRRGADAVRTRKLAEIRPNNPAVVTQTELILGPLAAARAGLAPRLRDEVVIKFESETHHLKLAKWLRDLRSHPVG